MKPCPSCSYQIPENSRFCTQCGQPVDAPGDIEPDQPMPLRRSRQSEELNMRVLYAMVALLLLAVLFPPWETPPGHEPEFLGFHFILSPPTTSAGEGGASGVISRLLWTIELVTIAIAGFYFSWLFRHDPGTGR